MRFAIVSEAELDGGKRRCSPRASGSYEGASAKGAIGTRPRFAEDDPHDAAKGHRVDAPNDERVTGIIRC